MPLLTQNSSFLTSDLLLLILVPLPNSKGGVTTVYKVHELLIKISDILDNAVSKQVGNSGCI